MSERWAAKCKEEMENEQKKTLNDTQHNANSTTSYTSINASFIVFTIKWRRFQMYTHTRAHTLCSVCVSVCTVHCVYVWRNDDGSSDGGAIIIVLPLSRVAYLRTSKSCEKLSRINTTNSSQRTSTTRKTSNSPKIDNRFWITFICKPLESVCLGVCVLDEFQEHAIFRPFVCAWVYFCVFISLRSPCCQRCER